MPIVSGCCLDAFHLGHTPYGGSKVSCSFCHRTPFGGPLFQALHGHFMTGVGRVIRFQTARGPWPGATV